MLHDPSTIPAQIDEAEPGVVIAAPESSAPPAAIPGIDLISLPEEPDAPGFAWVDADYFSSGDEIDQLALGLEDDPVKIIQHVYDRIECQFYYGSRKGAWTTLIEGAGNDFDQCSLLVALLRAAQARHPTRILAVGYRYFFRNSVVLTKDASNVDSIGGWLNLPYEQGKYDYIKMAELLVNAGYPAYNGAASIPHEYVDRGFFRDILEAGVYQGTPYVNMARMVVQVRFVDSMGATQSWFVDPHLKRHVFTPTLDVGGMSSYLTVKPSMLTRAATAAGDNFNVNYTEGVNVSGMRQDLGLLAGQLIARLGSSAQMPKLGNLSALQVFGGESILPGITLPPSIYGQPFFPLQEPRCLPSYLSYLTDQTDPPWGEIPAIRASYIQIRSTNGALSWRFPTSQLRGRCISLTFDGGVGRLYLDTEVVAVESPVGTGDLEVVLSVEHGGPYIDREQGGSLVVRGNGSQDDAGFHNQYKRTSAYAICYGWGANSPQLIHHSRRRLEELRQTRTDSDSLVIAHSLNLVGLRWQLMTAMARRALHRQHEILAVSQHVCGRVGMDGISDISNASIFLDFPLDIMSMVPRFGEVTHDSIKLPLILDGWLASAFENAAIEQSAGELLANPAGVSAVRLVERHAAAGGRVYLLHTGNASASTTSLVSYPAAVKSALLAALQNPADRLLVPSSGSIAMAGSSPPWSGYAYNLFNRYSSGFNYSANIIQRLKGGLSTKPGILTTIKNLFSLGNLGRSLQSFGQALVSGADPVDMASGGFMLDETDLELGGDEPRGLHLSRYYSSRDARSNQTGLGQGWTHSYHLRLHRRSAPVEAMGGGDPFQCAPFMAAVHAARDLWDDTKVNRWMLSLIACNWAVDQMLNNAAEIELGPRTLTFIRLPDGTYLPPTGVAATLTETTSGGLPTGYTLTMRHGNTILFDGTGRATTIRDPYNKELTLAYDSTPEKKLATVTDAYSRTLTFNYTGTRLTGVSDSTGRSVTYSHDASGKKLESVTDVESKTTYYDTDANFRVWRHRDHDNRVITENVFDSQDRVIEQKAMGDATRLWKLYYTGYSTIEQDPAGARREFQWDEKRRLVAQVDQMGRKTTFTYDGQDHRLRTKLPLGQVSESVYDAFHNVTSVTVAPTEADLAVPASRRVTQLVYDPATQHLDYAIDPRNKTSQVRYNAYHQVDQAISAEGVKVESEFYAVGHAHAGLLWKKHVYRDATNKDTTTFAYDANGHVQRIDYPDGTNVQFTHNARGDMLTRTDQRDHTTTFQYNNRRQPRFIFLPQVNGTTYQSEQQYDNAGNPSISIDAYSNTTTTLFNALRKPVTTTFQDTTTLTRDYDERDWLETVTDHLSNESTRTFHADGQVHEVFDPLNRKRVVSTYDGNGRPEYSSTPKPNTGTGRATSQTEYTGFGEVFKAHDPLGNFTQFQYDSGGNLETRTNKRSDAWTFTYNDDNQLEDTTSPGNKTVQKRYNARGLLETVTEPSNQTTTFHYDSMGRLDDSVDAVGTIDYAYDDAGQTDTITEGATIIDRDYDALGRLTRYQHGTDYTLQWEYHDPQNAVSLVYPDGVKKVRYDFDNRGRLWKVTDWAGRVTRYQYDDAGRLRWTHRDYNGTKREVKYDAASQIIAIEERDKNGGAIALFRYLEHWDNGQIKNTFTLPLPQAQALTLPIMTYNADNQLLTWKASAATAAQNVVHDADGNTTTGPLPDLSSPAAAARWASFGFDARNRLTSVTATGVSSTHSYDAENLRTSVTENGVTSQWVVNPHGLSGLSEALVRVKGGITTRYVYGLGLLYEEDEAATPVVRTYHFDRQGSTAALTATDGLTVTDRFEYAAYGERTHRTGSTDTPFQFNGFFGVQTDASGLLYMRARYYNVETRRFQSADPMGFAESSNFYWFANADPVSLVDPFGLGASDGGGFWRGIMSLFGDTSYQGLEKVTRAYSSASHYGSSLGGTLGKIPVLGYVLGPLGTILSGLGNTFMGNFGAGFSQIGHGAGIFIHDTAADVFDFGFGMTVGKGVGIYRAWNSGFSVLGALGETVKVLAVPNVGWMTGAEWGIRPGTRGYNQSAYMGDSRMEFSGLAHDLDTYREEGDFRSKRIDHWNWVQNAVFGPGYEPGLLGQGVRVLGIPFFGAVGLLSRP